MSPISREFLSASLNGRFISVVASGSPGTLIHTATNVADEKDEIWLWGTNNTGADAAVTIEWGGTSDTADISKVAIPASQGRQLLIAGETLAGGLNVRVFSDHASATVSGVVIGGHVNRITP